MSVVIVTIILYILRMLVVGTATGMCFIKLNLFPKMKDEQIMFVGVASTPMFVGLMDYLAGLVFIGWPIWIYYVIPFALSAGYLAYKHNYRALLFVAGNIWQYLKNTVKNVGEWIYLDILLALGIVFGFMCNFCYPSELTGFVCSVVHSLNFWGWISVLLLLTVLVISIVYIIRKMHKENVLKSNCYIILFVVVAAYSLFYGMSFNSRPDMDSDRAHYQLNARYFAEDRNSWELDNYSDEKYGSSHTDDHGPLWTMYLADAQMQAKMMGMDDPVRISNFAVFWSLCCFYIILFFTASWLAGTYTAGIVSLYLLLLYRYIVLVILGSRDAFRLVGLLLLTLYVFNVVSDIAEDKAKIQHYIFMPLLCYLCMNGHEGNVYIMLGLFIVVACLLIFSRTKVRNLLPCGLGVLCGTLLGITKTIHIYLETGLISSSTSLPFHGTPVVQTFAEINNKRADWSTIWASYTRPVVFMMCLGILGLTVMIIISVIKKEKELLWHGLIIAGMLLPMTGIMDWIGYEVSRWFAEQLRYRIYFLMIFAITGSWLLTQSWTRRYIRNICSLVVVVVVGMYILAECDRASVYNRPYIKECQSWGAIYNDLADTVLSLTDGDVFTRNQVILYYLHGTPKLLYHIYAEELIQAKTDEEIERAMDNLNVGAILLPESGVDYHDYSLLPFWDYINEDDSFTRIPDEESGYVIFLRN